MKYNRFEKHSTNILVFTFIVALFFAVFGVEMLLSFMQQEEKRETIVRNIRLKENPPSIIEFIIPSDIYMRKTDSLEKKNRFATDEDGYIYPSRIHEQPDITILFIGGSTTECKYVDEENRFPYLVGRLLEKDGKKVNSLNSGVSGNNSMHSIDILLNKGLTSNPDVVVMMHNINDLSILLYENTYWNKNPHRSLLVENNPRVSNYSHIKGILRNTLPNIYERLSILKHQYSRPGEVDEFAHARERRLSIDKQGILEKFARNLRAFITISRLYEVIPVLMTQASRFKKTPDKVIIENWTLEKRFGIKYEEYRDIYLQMNRLIREVGVSNNVLVIDLAKEVPQTKVYMYDFVHFNDHGSKYVSTLIADQLNGLVYNVSPTNNE